MRRLVLPVATMVNVSNWLWVQLIDATDALTPSNGLLMRLIVVSLAIPLTFFWLCFYLRHFIHQHGTFGSQWRHYDMPERR
jgi:hypothetical protein